MKTLIKKIQKITLQIDLIKGDLFFQALPDENKRDYYKMIDAYKTFLDNLPNKH
jgi:hypothetical protein